MVIDINDTLLESIKKELLETLNAAESRVVDMFEFGETHGSDETISFLHAVRNTLLLIDEPAAAALCETLQATIETALGNDDIEEHSEVADSFLTLSQYITRLSIGSAQQGSGSAELDAKLLASAQKSLTVSSPASAGGDNQLYRPNEKQRQILTAAVKATLALSPSQDMAFWKMFYRSTKAARSAVNTQESYEFIWLLEQVSILSVKGRLRLDAATQQQLLSSYNGYLKFVVQQGESLVGYQENQVADTVTTLNKLTHNAQLLRNDYTPPSSRLSAEEGDDDLSLSLVFPVSAETIETTAFLIKKELSSVKGQFEEAIKEQSLASAVVRKQLSVGLKPSKDAFKILGFSTGYVLTEEAEKMLAGEGSDAAWQAKFAENLILVEDALWQLDRLESEGLVNPYDAATHQKAHTKNIAAEAATVITAQSSYEFFKSARESLIENFDHPDSLDMMEFAKSIHDVRSAATLLGQEALAKQLANAEKLQLFLANRPTVWENKNCASVYMDVLVGYEIIFEQLKSSLTIDERALRLVIEAQKQFAAIAHFNPEQMAKAEYLDYDGQDEVGVDDMLADELVTDVPQIEEDDDLELDAPEDDVLELYDPEEEETAPVTDNPEQSSDDKGDDMSPVLRALTQDAQPNSSVTSLPNEEVDEDILEIFLEEGQGIAEQLEGDIARLAGNYFDQDLIGDIRRAFHTLKGSGRMVGLNVFGEFAWQYEELFNKAVNKDIELNDITQELLTNARQLVEKTVNSEPFAEDRDELLLAAAQAEAVNKFLQSGKPLPTADELNQTVAAPAIAEVVAGSGSGVGWADVPDSDGQSQHLTARVEQQQLQGQEALNEIAEHPALAIPQEPVQKPEVATGSQANALSAGDVTSTTKETSDKLDKIAQTADLIGGLGDVQHEDLAAVFHALKQIDKETLGDKQQQLTEQLDAIAELSRSKVGGKLEQGEVQHIADAIRALGGASSEHDLAKVSESLKAIQTDWEAQKEHDLSLDLTDVSWMIDYVETANQQYKDWRADRFHKNVPFSNLHQNAIAIERMLLNNRIENPIALSVKLRELLDEISRRNTTKQGLKAQVTSAVESGIAEIHRVLSAMHAGEADVIPEALPLNNLNDAIDILKAQYVAYSGEKGKEDTDEQKASSGLTSSTLRREKSAAELAREKAREEARERAEATPEGNHHFSDYVATAASKLKEAKEQFSSWEKEAFGKTQAFDDLRTKVEELKHDAAEAEHIDSVFVTEAMTLVLDEVAESDRSPTAMEAKPIKYAIEDLARIHSEVALGEAGEASELVLSSLVETAESIKEQVQQPVMVAPQTYAMHPDGSPIMAEQVVDTPPMAIASGYFGMAGNLTDNIAAVKAQFSPANLVQGAFQHEKLIDSLYDVEASLDEGTTPQWAWEALSNLENTISSMHEKSLLPSPEDYGRITKTLDAINNSEGVDAKEAKDLNNALMGIRAELIARQEKAELAGRFASKAKSELQATDESFDVWKGSGFIPSDELSDLIDNVDNVSMQSKIAEYTEAEELSSLVNTVLNRLQDENVVPFDEVSHVMEVAVDEMTAVRSQLHGGDLASPDLKSSLESQGHTVSIGVEYVPLNDATDLSDKPPVSVDEVESVIKQGVLPTDASVSDKPVSETAVASQAMPSETAAVEPQPQQPQTTDSAVAQQQGVKLADSDNVTAIADSATTAEPTAAEFVADSRADESIEVAAETMADSEIDTDANGVVDAALTIADSAPDQMSEQDKKGFVKSAKKHIRTSREHFDDWEQTGFSDEVPLEKLSSDVKNISRVSREHNFQSAENLGNFVSEVLDRIYENVLVPDAETTRSVSDAIDEFGRTSDAIRDNDTRPGKQSIDTGLLDKIRNIAAMPTLGTPISLESDDYLALLEQREARHGNDTEDLGDSGIVSQAKAMATRLSRQSAGDETVPSGSLEVTHSNKPKSGQSEAIVGSAVSDGYRSDGLVASASVSRHQPFADEVQPLVSKSQKSYDNWELTGFEPNDKLEDLSRDVDDITEISAKHSFGGGVELAQSVGEVLSTVAESGVAPSAETTEQVGEAIKEFSRSTDAIHGNTDGQEIRREVIHNVQRVAKSVAEASAAISSASAADTSVSETASVSSSVLSGQAGGQIAGASGVDADGGFSVSSLATFADEVQPMVNKSQDSYSNWETTGFEPNEHLDELSEDVDGITQTAGKHGFDSGVELGQSVGDVLSTVADSGVAPSAETGEQVGEAIAEFSRSTDAIQGNAEGQEIRAEVINKTQQVAKQVVAEAVAGSSAIAGSATEVATEAAVADAAAQASDSVSSSVSSGQVGGQAASASGVGADDGFSVSSLATFADEVQPMVNKSQDSYSNWETTGFEPNEHLDELSDDVGDITQTAGKHGFDSGVKLGQSVGDVLLTVAESGVTPSTETGEQVGEAIAEFSRSADAIQGNAEGQEIRAEVINKTQQVAKQVVEEAAEAVAGATTQAKAKVSRSVSGSVLDNNSVFGKNKAKGTSGVDADDGFSVSGLATFADEVQPMVNKSQDSYSNWETTGFEPNEHLDELSEDVDGITQTAGKHGFDSGVELGQSVGDVLSTVADSGIAPSAETGEQVGEAIAEFSRSTDAIQANAEGQAIRAEVISKTQQVAQQVTAGATTEVATAGTVVAGDVSLGAENRKISGTDVSAKSADGDSLNTSKLQPFADEVQPLVNKSKKSYDDWGMSDFDFGDEFFDLSRDVKDITGVSEKHNFNSGVELGQSVSDVLSQVANAGVKPSTEATEQVGEAIAEFSRSTAAIQANAEGQEIRPEVIANVQQIAGQGGGAGVAKTAAERVAEASFVSASPYAPFVREAHSTIEQSKAHFDDWRLSDFELNQQFDRLSGDVKGLTEMSERHHYDSAASLGRAVDDVLSRIASSGIKPDMSTTAQVESAIGEFSRAAEAIKDNQLSEQEIRSDVIGAVRATFTQRAVDDSSVVSSVTAHEMFAKPSASAMRASLAEFVETPLEEPQEKPKAKTPTADEATQADAASAIGAGADQAEDSKAEEAVHDGNNEGLKFNDPNTLDATILDIFLSEAKDIVQKNVSSLSDWKADHGDLTALQEIQRGLHTLKGGARMAELTVLGDLSHNIETLLDAIVDGKVEDKNGACDVLQSGLSLGSDMVTLADNHQMVVESPEYYEMLNTFMRAQTGKSLELPAPKRQISKPATSADGSRDNTPQPSSSAGRNKSQRRSYMLRVRSELIDKLTGLVGEDVIARSRVERHLADHGFQLDELSRTVERLAEQLRRLENETEAQILFRHDTVGSVNEDFDPLELDRFSEMQQLSRLLAESMHDLQSIRGSLDNFVEDTRQILLDQNNIQSELQGGILSASLVRFDSIAPRIELLVEQVAAELGKEIQVQMYGGQNDIERNMLEDLIPGFEHTIRNSLSHGIEMPDEREKVGKPRRGRIRIAVRREGAEIGFMIADDGRGANLDAIRDKARRLNILDEAQANDKDYLLQLLFEPGFSTQEQATQLSGRGIGMDVLRDVIDSHQGTIEVETEAGKGMATFIRMPFAMSITEALSVRIGRYRYAIPVVSIEGVARLSQEIYEPFELGQTTYYTYGQNRYKLESLLEFIDPYGERTPQPQGVPVLLVRVGSKRLAMEVDEIEGRQEIIIKSVNPQFTSLPGIIGAAVLDSGEPVPVMEATTLGRHFLNFQEMNTDIRDLINPEILSSANIQPRVLVVDDSITMRKVTSKILSKYDIEHETAKDGLDAIDVLSEFTPDVILLDIEMPRMDGFEFATHVRNDSLIPDVPIVMITSRTGEKHRERADSIGVNDYLGKPYTEETLIGSLETILGKKLLK